MYVFGPETHMTAIVGMALGTRSIPQENNVEFTTANFLLPSGDKQPIKKKPEEVAAARESALKAAAASAAQRRSVSLNLLSSIPSCWFYVHIAFVRK